MLINATQLRVGQIISRDDTLFRVIAVDHVARENRRGVVQAKLRNLRTGMQTEQRFRSDDRIERVSLEQRTMEFLYTADGLYHFMDIESYEQVALDTETVGEAVRYLTPNLRVQVEMHEERPLGVALPKTVDLRVVETAPGLKTATVTNVLKPATVETGLVVQVPNFIEPGDVIRVDTDSGAYLSRAKGE